MFEYVSQGGNGIFLKSMNKSYSYLWLKEKVTQISGLFRERKIQKGDRLLLSISDESEFAAVFITALLNGIVTVMLDPETRKPRATAVIEKTAPALIIADRETIQRWSLPGIYNDRILSYRKNDASSTGLLGKFLSKSKKVVDDTDYVSILSKSVPAADFPEAPEEEDLAYIIFTSGTTAQSKGVAISHGNLTAHLETLRNVYNLSQKSVLLNPLLLWHADGCIQGPILAAYAGCAWHQPFSFSINKIGALLDYGYANNISHWFVVPAMLNMIVSFSDDYEDAFSYPSFEALISVSAHLNNALWDKAETKFKIKIHNVYGLTETVAGSLFCGPLSGTYKKYTAGKGIDTAWRIVDDKGNDADVGDQGELWLKGHHIMKSYYNDPDTTAKSFENGWFMTGDIAVADKDGFITICGRKKNLIISGGFNIQPEEVTECLLQNQAVSEACALGLPDEIFGEKLVAAVVLRPGHVINSIAITEHCRQFLEEKKVPQRVFILDSFPKGVSGKIQLPELRERLLSEVHEPVNVSGDLLDHVLAVAAASFQVPVEDLSIADTSQSVSGWDSLAHLTFVTLLEERFNIRFATAEVMTLNSIMRAVHLVKEKNA